MRVAITLLISNETVAGEWERSVKRRNGKNSCQPRARSFANDRGSGQGWACRHDVQLIAISKTHLAATIRSHHPLNHRSGDVTASTMITAECAARRASRYPCQVDEREQYNSHASKGNRRRYTGLMKSRIFLRRTRQSSAIAASRR